MDTYKESDFPDESSLEIAGSSINLESVLTFLDHPWLEEISTQYKRDATLANTALKTIVKDLYELNEKYREKYHRTILTSVDGRVKTFDSFMKKLYDSVCETSKNEVIVKDTLKVIYSEIRDLCGIRFSCAYFDEVEPIINKLIRPYLLKRGYATAPGDKNYLEDGDEHGYRSFHFFVKIPTVVNIFKDVESCLCEVQGRTELQHAWAVKSHDLLYKRTPPLVIGDVMGDMKEVSNSLRSLDQFLVSIRNRLGEATEYEL